MRRVSRRIAIFPSHPRSSLPSQQPLVPRWNPVPLSSFGSTFNWKQRVETNLLTTWSQGTSQRRQLFGATRPTWIGLRRWKKDKAFEISKAKDKSENIYEQREKKEKKQDGSVKRNQTRESKDEYETETEKANEFQESLEETQLELAKSISEEKRTRGELISKMLTKDYAKLWKGLEGKKLLEAMEREVKTNWEKWQELGAVHAKNLALEERLNSLRKLDTSAWRQHALSVREQYVEPFINQTSSMLDSIATSSYAALKTKMKRGGAEKEKKSAAEESDVQEDKEMTKRLETTMKDLFMGTLKLDRSSFDKLKEKIVRPAQDAVDEQFKKLRSLSKTALRDGIIANDPLAKTPAVLRVADGLAPEELEFLAHRNKRTKDALEKFLGKSLPVGVAPRIALCGSGLYDGVTYNSTLSGSSWALGQLMTAGEHEDPTRLPNMQQFKEGVKARVGELAPYTRDHWAQVTDTFLTKYAFDKSFSIVDLYGLFLQHALLAHHGKEGHKVRLSEQMKVVASGDHPFPIYSAVSRPEKLRDWSKWLSFWEKRAAANPNFESENLSADREPDGEKSNPRSVKEGFDWFEFTPAEVGNISATPEEMAFAPTWAFGRSFDHFSSVDNAPELSFGYLLAVFGSAFCAHAMRVNEEFYEQVIYRLAGDPRLHTGLGQLRLLMEEQINKRGLAYTHLLNPARFNNPYYAHRAHPLPRGASSHKFISLLDAGVHINLPLPPLLRRDRGVDIIIAFDSSVRPFDSLRAAERYAQSQSPDHCLRMPPIDYTDSEPPILPHPYKRPPPRQMYTFEPNMKLPPSAHPGGALPPTILYVPLTAETPGGFDPLENAKTGGFCGTASFRMAPDNVEMLSGLAERNLMRNRDTIAAAIQKRAEWKRKHRREIDDAFLKCTSAGSSHRDLGSWIE